MTLSLDQPSQTDSLTSRPLRRRATLLALWRSGRSDGLLGVAIVIVVWESLTRLDVLPSTYLPPVSTIVIELVDLIGTSELWIAIGWTLFGWGLGLLFAVGVALPTGLMVGLSSATYRSVRVLIETLRSIPSVALIPVIVLFSGVSMSSLVYLAIYASFWPLFIQVIYGVQDLEPVTRATATVFKLSRLSTLWHVTLPSALPYIGTGTRIASTTSLMVVVATGIVIGAPGLGLLISRAQTGGAVAKMYALLVVMGTLAWLLNVIISLIERRLLHWHPSQHTGRE